MNTTVGKSFGLALLLAVGIIAVMVAMGTFSAQKAGAAVTEGSVELSLTNQNPDAQTGVTVTFTENVAITSTTSPLAITFAGLTLGESNDFDEKVTITGPTDGGDVTYTVANGEATTSDQDLSLVIPADIDVSEGADGAQVFIAGEYTVTVAVGEAGMPDADTPVDSTPTFTTVDSALAATATATAMATAMVDGQTSDGVPIYTAGVLSSQDAGAGVSLEINLTVPDGGITISDEVVIELKDFQVPATIDANAISINGGTVGTANAADVSVSGTEITVETPDLNGTGDEGGLTAGPATIRFRSRAGIQNPTMSGDGYVVKVSHREIVLYERNPGPIDATLKIAPDNGLSGAEIEVSGVGYTNGTATIYHTGGAEVPDTGDTVPDGFTKIGSAAVSGGSFSTSVTAGDAFGAAGNDVVARSSTGAWGPTAEFTVNGAISIPESVTKGTDLTVKVSKWSTGDITRATINGANMNTTGADEFTPVDPGDDNAAEFKIRVGTGALLGEQTLVLYTDSGSAGSKNINIIGIALTVSPQQQW